MTSSAPGPTTVGALFSHRVTASDADGDALAFTLLSGPDGLEVDPRTGGVLWLTTLADAGTHPVEIGVSDLYGGSAVEPPEVVVTADPTPACAGEPLVVCVGASDDVGLTSVSLTADGLDVPLDLRECALVDAVLGTVHLVGAARDANDQEATDVLDLAVVDCGLPVGPSVVVTSPEAGSRVGVPVDVIATATPEPGTGAGRAPGRVAPDEIELDERGAEARVDEGDIEGPELHRPVDDEVDRDRGGAAGVVGDLHRGLRPRLAAPARRPG